MSRNEDLERRPDNHVGLDESQPTMQYVPGSDADDGDDFSLNQNGDTNGNVGETIIVQNARFEWEKHAEHLGLLGSGGNGVVNAERLDHIALGYLKDQTTEFIRSVVPGNFSGEECNNLVAKLDADLTQLGKSGSPVATKVMLPGSMSAGALERLQRREARGLLVHGPNIPSAPVLYGMHTTEKSLRLVLEFVPGYTLNAVLQELPDADKRDVDDVRLESSLAAVISRDFYTAHGYAGIIHRDIKPDNIMIADNGETKIMDFGLVKHTSSNETQMTTSDTVMGTAVYMSPKQARGNGSESTLACDVFALGMTLSQMFTGQAPYGGSNGTIIEMVRRRASLDRVASIHIPRPIGADENVIGYLMEVESFLAKMIHPDEDMRPTMEEVAMFFAKRSEFGQMQFDAFADLDAYHDAANHLQVVTNTPPIDYKKQFAKSRFETPTDAYQALKEGAKVRATNGDFFEGYAGRFADTITIPAQKQQHVAQTRSASRNSLLAAAGLSAAILIGGVVYYFNPKTKSLEPVEKRAVAAVDDPPQNTVSEVLTASVPHSDLHESVVTESVDPPLYIPTSVPRIVPVESFTYRLNDHADPNSLIRNVDGRPGTLPYNRIVDFEGGRILFEDNQFRGYEFGDVHDALRTYTSINHKAVTPDGKSYTHFAASMQKEEQQREEAKLFGIPFEEMKNPSSVTHSFQMEDGTTLILFNGRRSILVSPDGTRELFTSTEEMLASPKAATYIEQISTGTFTQINITEQVEKNFRAKMIVKGIQRFVDEFTPLLYPEGHQMPTPNGSVARK